ncbi:MAG: hypothetical protein HYX67_16415 [Candidatus Melainabacteria bacterium]|nr:hypothetical protein [Candidatus Melainabacteria bacterium]
MANKLSIGLAVSLLLSGSFSGLAYADGGMSALEKQIMNGDAAPSAGNPDNFPWMNKDGSTKPSTKSEAATPAPTVSTPPPPPVREAAPATPATTEVWPHVPAVREEKLRLEHAEAAPKIEPEHAKAAETHPSAGRPLEKTTERATERPTETAAAKKPTMLFGRIEQLSASAGASFPSLKAQTPMMDPRGVLAGKATASAPILSGVVKSFPDNYQGNWGGRLVLQQVQVDPNYYRLDPEEARRTVQAMKPGNIGQVNFNFDRSRGAIALEPARCLFMVPAGDTQVPDEMKKMLGGGAGNTAFGGMMSQMVSGMNVPIVLEFGDVQTGAGETSVSGNQMRQRVLKNETRQLAANVLEQQIVTEETTWDKRTHIPRTGYGESVVRFTRQSPTVLYVQCATVSYDANKRFLEKMVLYGSIGKGVVMNTDPMQAMQGAGGMGGLGGLGGLQGMFGGGGGAGQTPTMPAGGLDGMLKNLFGGQ